MNRSALIVSTLALTSAANAATLRLYFSTTGLAGGVLSAPPPEYTSHANPTVPVGTTVYIYASVIDTGTWNGISIDFTGADGQVTMVPNHWGQPPVSDLSGRLNGTNPVNLVAPTQQGLPNPYPLDVLDNLAITAADGSVCFYLGSSTTTAAGSVFMHVGQGGIARVGGNPATDLIFLGWCDAGLHGNNFGAASTLADLRITPGPVNILRADTNCDGVVNNLDIDSFVLALTNPASYNCTYPNCNIRAADINMDNAVNSFDIGPFVLCLAHSGCP